MRITCLTQKKHAMSAFLITLTVMAFAIMFLCYAHTRATNIKINETQWLLINLRDEIWPLTYTEKIVRIKQFTKKNSVLDECDLVNLTQDSYTIGDYNPGAPHFGFVLKRSFSNIFGPNQEMILYWDGELWLKPGDGTSPNGNQLFEGK